MGEGHLRGNDMNNADNKDPKDPKTRFTCLNRFIGKCKGCTRDYNKEHHPNNLDCPNYREIPISIVNIEK